jgi:hypothetical protein
MTTPGVGGAKGLPVLLDAGANAGANVSISGLFSSSPVHSRATSGTEGHTLAEGCGVG